MPNIANKTIEKVLSYNFKNKSILKLALTHSSIKQNPNSYERLEFFGDSIVGFIVSEWLYKKEKKLDQGKLTVLKNTLVSRKNMTLIAKEMNLIKYAIIHKSVDLDSQTVVNRINSDLYESIVAAIYLDSNYLTVKDFIYKTLLAFKSIKEDNYKGKLNEICHEKKISTPIYSVILNTGPDHNKKYKVKVLIGKKFFFGKGTKVKEAEIDAAKKALINLFSF